MISRSRIIESLSYASNQMDKVVGLESFGYLNEHMFMKLLHYLLIIKA